MAVYKRNYQRYDGPLTETPWRFTILLRYAVKEVFDSKLFTAFFSICFGPTLGAFLIIYLTQRARLPADAPLVRRPPQGEALAARGGGHRDKQ